MQELATCEGTWPLALLDNDPLTGATMVYVTMEVLPIQKYRLYVFILYELYGTIHTVLRIVYK